MPSLAPCPHCGTDVLLMSMADRDARVLCPSCSGEFSIGEVAEQARALSAAVAVAATPWDDAGIATPAQTQDETLQFSFEEPSSAEGAMPDFESVPDFDDAVQTFSTDVESGEIEITGETWTYPGFAVAETTLLVASVQAPIVEQLKVALGPTWKYPGCDDWCEGIIVETAAPEEPVPVGAASEPWASTPATSSTAEYAPRSVARSRRKKQADMSFLLLIVGVVGGGVIGLVLGYLILVAIGGPPADFAGLFY